MRICKIMPSFPTRETPGAGLTGFRPSCIIAEPTCYITPAFDEPAYPIPAHIRVVKLKLWTRQFWQASNSKRWLRRGRQIVYLGEFGWRSLWVALRQRPDILVTGIFHLPVGLILRRLTGCKYALTLHNMTVVEFIWQHKWIARLAAGTDLIFVVSSPMQRMMQDLIPEAAVVLRPTGVDLDLFRDYGTERKPQIITVGSFKWKKGYTYLLEAMRLVVDRHPGYRLLIVGDGPEREAIEQRIRDLGLRQHVKLLGHVPQTDIVHLSNESYLFVMASLREGLPKALHEALACGLPVVVTAGCNASEFIEPVGLEVPIKDPQALADAMSLLISDQRLRDKLASQARWTAQAFSWEQVAKIELEALRSVLDSRDR